MGQILACRGKIYRLLGKCLKKYVNGNWKVCRLHTKCLEECLNGIIGKIINVSKNDVKAILEKFMG
jgi:hypothetical protein